MGRGHLYKDMPGRGPAWLQRLTVGAHCGWCAPQLVHLCGVDDAVLKEHAGAITAHHRGVAHFEDDPCAVHLTGFRQRLLRGRAFCGNNVGRAFSLSHFRAQPGRGPLVTDQYSQSPHPSRSCCLQPLGSGTLGWQGPVLALLASLPCELNPKFQNSKNFPNFSVELRLV